LLIKVNVEDSGERKVSDEKRFELLKIAKLGKLLGKLSEKG
jgi:hypothetical protein